MLAPRITLKLVIGLLAIALPTASAGCYKRGPTFDDFYASSGWTQNKLVQAIANEFAGSYGPNEARGACFEANALFHVIVVLQHVKGNSEYMQASDIRNDGYTETGACQHGSESAHGDWWYRIDPEDGKNCSNTFHPSPPPPLNFYSFGEGIANHIILDL
ncbi:hypothetical protein V502_02246 [Pseudogymnoascus sp. VKM F-4520 (FW-2644)]|nr:hypothetical protein V502_02246 [Pseudogymnoascus sp. VKM F-4520 (FW-2644)]